MKSSRLLNFLLCFGFISTSTISYADAPLTVSTIDSSPVSELWINPGFYTYHFQSSNRFNNINLGWGGEYRYSTTSSFVLGKFHNSDWGKSDYIGWYWRPFQIGSLSFGAEIGAINGYPKMQNGSWFPMVVPVASFENKYMGANFVFVPSYNDQLHGGISIQFKLKVY
jgi:hypothetical protein